MRTHSAQGVGIGLSVEFDSGPGSTFVVSSISPGEAAARDGSIGLSLLQCLRPDIPMCHDQMFVSYDCCHIRLCLRNCTLQNVAISLLQWMGFVRLTGQARDYNRCASCQSPCGQRAIKVAHCRATCSEFLGRPLPRNSNGIRIIMDPQGARVSRTRSGAADKSLVCKLHAHLTFNVGELCPFRLFWGRPAASAV
jgi:hypothetical protein